MAAPSITQAGAETRPTCIARKHNENTYHRRRCTCAAGREALRVYRKRRREGRSQPRMCSPVATVRRLRGFMADGYTGPMIAAVTGLRDNYVCDLVRDRRKQIHTSTRDAVERAVAVLEAQPGPSPVTRRRAAKAGYVPLDAWTAETIEDPSATPYDWVDLDAPDEVAVERAIRAVRVGLPPPPGLSRAESATAAVRLAQPPYRLHDTAIADGLRHNNRWVRKVREAAGVPQVPCSPGRKAA